jgi:hypothetical protein
MLLEARLADVAIVGHRALCVDAALVRLHADTPSRQDRDNESDDR